MKKLIIFILMGLLLISGSVLAEYDFGGETIKIGYDRDISGWYTDDPNDEAWFHEVEEMFNVNIEFIGGVELRTSDFLEYLAPQIMEGETEADIIMSRYPATTNAAGDEGLLYALDDFYPEGFWEETEEELKKEYYLNPADGKNYGFPTDRLVPAGQVIIYNKDMLEREGLPDLYELWQEDDWTWDALMDICMQVTKDTSGDGEIDQWGIASGIQFDNRVTEWDIPSFLVSNNVTLLEMDDGKLKSNLNSPEVIETLEFMQELYLEGGIHAGIRWGELDGRRGYESFELGEVAMIVDRPLRLSRISGMEDDFRVVPFPKGPRGTDYTVTRTDAITGTIPISIDAEKIEPLIDLFSTLNRVRERHWEMLDTDEFIEERISGNADLMRDEEGIEALRYIDKNNTLWDQHNDYLMRSIWPDYENLYGRIFEDEEDPTTVVEAINPVAQAHLDDLFDQ